MMRAVAGAMAWLVMAGCGSGAAHAWLACDECTSALRDSVVREGAAARHVFADALVPASQAATDSVRAQMLMAWRMMQRAARARGRRLTAADSIAVVERGTQEYFAERQYRAALGLAAIHDRASRRVLTRFVRRDTVGPGGVRPEVWRRAARLLLTF